MKFLPILVATLLLMGTSVAQDTNNQPVRPERMPYMERLERGFGQMREPRFAGDRPEWMKKEEADKRVQKLEITIEHRGPRGPMMNRGGFRGGPRGPMMNQEKSCPLCEKHQKKVDNKKHGKKQYRGGKRSPMHRHL